MTKSTPDELAGFSEPGRWPLELAAARLDDLVALAGHEGPQRLTIDGRDVAVVTAVNHPAAKPLTGRDIIDAMQRCPDPELFDRIEALRTNRDGDH